MRVGRVFGVCAVGSAGVPARRKLKVESFLTQRRRDAEILRDGGVIAAEGGTSALSAGKQTLAPSQARSELETIILPQRKAARGDTRPPNHALIMSIMSKINLKLSKVRIRLCKTRCCGRGRLHPGSASFSPETHDLAHLCRQPITSGLLFASVVMPTSHAIQPCVQTSVAIFTIWYNARGSRPRAPPPCQTSESRSGSHCPTPECRKSFRASDCR